MGTRGQVHIYIQKYLYKKSGSCTRARVFARIEISCATCPLKTDESQYLCGFGVGQVYGTVFLKGQV